MIEFLEFLKGYVRIRVSGFSPERFMNLCSNKGILLWDIEKKADAYYMNIGLEGFFQIKSIVRKTGTKAAICKRCGLPFLLPHIWSRKMFLTGLFLAVIFWIGSSFFVWDISIDGNRQITDEYFEQFLKSTDVRIGMRKELLDIEALERDIRRQFPEITWASAKMDGTRLLISVKENDAPIVSQAQLPDVPSELVAEYDGVIKEIIVRKGEPLVKKGDVIAKDDVLVEGKIPVHNDDGTIREYQYVRADADILMEHPVTFRDILPFDYIKKEYTGRAEKVHFLRIGEKEYGPPFQEPFLVYDSVIKTERPLLFEKLSVPVYWGTYVHREYVNKEYRYSKEQAYTLLNEKINTFIESLSEKGVQIIEKNVRIDVYDKNWIVQGDFLVEEQTGVSREIQPETMGEIAGE